MAQAWRLEEKKPLGGGFKTFGGNFLRGGSGSMGRCLCHGRCGNLWWGQKKAKGQVDSVKASLPSVPNMCFPLSFDLRTILEDSSPLCAGHGYCVEVWSCAKHSSTNPPLFTI